MKSLTEGIYALAITLWIGGIWAIGYIVAPTLFWSLPDRALAGSLAGKLFTLMAYVSIACAAYVLLFRLARHGGACFRHGIFWAALAMLGLTLAGEFGVVSKLYTKGDEPNQENSPVDCFPANGHTFDVSPAGQQVAQRGARAGQQKTPAEAGVS